MAALLCDLDNFKVVNDSLGHEAGDEILVAVADRLRLGLRDHDLPCRLGGDEFAVLVENAEPQPLAQRLVEDLREPFGVAGREFYLSVSIGVTDCRAGEVAADQLLRHADVALYRAKARGGGCYSMFEAAMLDPILERVELEAELRHALRHDQFIVYYQPKYQARSGALVGVEALVRWEHPRRGLVPPRRVHPRRRSQRPHRPPRSTRPRTGVRPGCAAGSNSTGFPSPSPSPPPSPSSNTPTSSPARRVP